MCEFEYRLEVLQVADADVTVLTHDATLSLVATFAQRAARCRFVLHSDGTTVHAVSGGKAPVAVRSPHPQDSVSFELFAQVNGSSATSAVAVSRGTDGQEEGVAVGGPDKEVGVRWVPLVACASPATVICRVQVMWEVTPSHGHIDASLHIPQDAGAVPDSEPLTEAILAETTRKDSHNCGFQGTMCATAKVTDTTTHRGPSPLEDGQGAVTPPQAGLVAESSAELSGWTRVTAVPSKDQMAAGSGSLSAPSPDGMDSADAAHLQSTGRFRDDDEGDHDEADFKPQQQPASEAPAGVDCAVTKSETSAVVNVDAASSLTTTKTSASKEEASSANIMYLPKVGEDGETGDQVESKTTDKGGISMQDAEHAMGFDAVEGSADFAGARADGTTSTTPFLDVFATSTQHGVPVSRAYANLFTVPAPVLLLARKDSKGVSSSQQPRREPYTGGMLRERGLRATGPAAGGPAYGASGASGVHWLSQSALESLRRERCGDGEGSVTQGGSRAAPTAAAASLTSGRWTSVTINEENRTAMQHLKEEVFERAERKPVACNWRKY